MEADTRHPFLRLSGDLDTPMFIVTARAGERLAGCLVGFATQVSIEPPRFLVCLSKQNATHRVAFETATLAVHVVPREREALAELFGGETGDEVDKFRRCAWSVGEDGAPLLDDCPTRFLASVRQRIDMGDHTGFVLDPRHAQFVPGDQLTLRRARRIDPGHPA